ncbi:ead/Ea22-like family protein, partial [Escherichia coli]
MSKIDYQALREAAEKATPGNWWIDSHGQAMV